MNTYLFVLYLLVGVGVARGMTDKIWPAVCIVVAWPAAVGFLVSTSLMAYIESKAR